jgi:hypothetical protein
MTHRHHHHDHPHAPVLEEKFLEGHALLYGVTHDDPQRLRALMLEMLGDVFGDDDPALPERILLRLGALAEMWRHPLMEAWKTAPASPRLGDTALRVAATHPLTDTGWFDDFSFFAEMLRRMHVEGQA